MYKKNNYPNYAMPRHNPQQGYYPQPAPHYAQPAPKPPKKSGAIYSKIKKGNFEGLTIVNAWNKSSKGLVTAKVAPYKNSEVLVQSEKGHEYIKMIAEITYHKTGHVRLIPVLMNMKTEVIAIQEMGMCITPKGGGTTSSGKRVTGYFGTMFQK